MNLTDDLLQGLIEQLENGEVVDGVAADLPTEEAEVIRLIAALRQIPPFPGDEAIVAAQEAQLLTAVRTQYPPNDSTAPTLMAILLAHLQNWWSMLNNNRELVLGLAVLAIIIAATWLFSGRTSDNQKLTNNPVAVVTRDTNNEETISAPTEEHNIAKESADNTAVAIFPDDGPNTTYLPILSTDFERNAQTAIIENITGLVQIQTDGSTWQTVSVATGGATPLHAGQRIRTGDLSQASLTFYDGSQARLNANTEISIDQLDAQHPEDGFRTVVMIQWRGESDHQVDHRGDSGSLYEVKTPEGSGIARGTRFKVTVTPDQLARYIVTEGKVDVTSLNQTVSVTAGQLTTLLVGSPPETPAFTITGEGLISAIGSEWTVAGQTFSTHALTIIIGNPQVGDLVHVDGHLLEDGSRVADRIILLHRAAANQFSLTGEVSAIGPDWTVAGQTIATTSQTNIDEGIVVGDTVRVEGLILEDGTLQAQTILRLEAAPGLPFQFSGIVQAINSDSWLISGQMIVVDGETVVSLNVTIGDTVTVQGWILEDGAWLAAKISLLEDNLPAFDFTGPINSIDPWVVAGISFDTGDWTTIAPGLSVGDDVRVQGTILSDGTWVADSIIRLSDTLPNIVTFMGPVTSIAPWIVNGLPLVVNGNTTVLGDITPGITVVVTAQLLPDGTWIVLSIRPLYPDFGLGCMLFSSPVVTINGDFIHVKHWHVDIKKDGRIHIHGDLKVNSIITVPMCTGWDGSIIIIGDIVVIYQPVVIIINNGNNLPPDCRITKKGHIRCSNPGSKKKS